MESLILNICLPLAYILIAVAFILAIVFPLIFMFSDLKKAKGSLMGVLAIFVLLFVCFLLSSGDTISGHEEVSASTMRMIDTGVYGVYALIAITIIAAVYSAVAGFFKK